MKKLLIGIALAIIALIIFLNIGGREKISTSEDAVYKNTINISRSYVALRAKTDKLLMNASEYPDYNTWNIEMTKLINDWKNLETEAKLLEKQADFDSEEKVSFRFINEVNAYSKEEISNVFDKAPAGKKIRTLAKYLGVDAKMAYKILQNDQELAADAWNKTGDIFKILENSAIIIKDGCKVAGFVGAVAITGGAAAGAAVGSAGVGTALVGGSATAFQATVLVVTGTDLILEVSEDAATIALGDKHKTVKAISNLRSYTDPAASILSLTDIHKNVGKGAELVDKIGVVLVQVDQVRSMLQDGKLLGINIKPDSTVEVAPLNEDEADAWIEEYLGEEIIDDYSDTLDEWLKGFEDLDDWMEEFNVEEGDESEDKAEAEEENDENNEDEKNNEEEELTKESDIKDENKNKVEIEKIDNKEKELAEETEKINAKKEEKSAEETKEVNTKNEDKVEEPVKAISNSGFTIQKLDCQYTGSWTSNWGAMTFTQSGNSVTATYTHDSGKISATANGNILIGTWSEAPSYASPKDAGDVELELSTDCKTFTGHWRYGSSGSWSGGWSGTKN